MAYSEYYQIIFVRILFKGLILKEVLNYSPYVNQRTRVLPTSEKLYHNLAAHND